MCAMDLDTMIHIVQRKQSSKEDMFGIILSRKNGEKRKRVLYINKGILHTRRHGWIKCLEYVHKMQANLVLLKKQVIVAPLTNQEKVRKDP